MSIIVETYKTIKQRFKFLSHFFSFQLTVPCKCSHVYGTVCIFGDISIEEYSQTL